MDSCITQLKAQGLGGWVFLTSEVPLLGGVGKQLRQLHPPQLFLIFVSLDRGCLLRPPAGHTKVYEPYIEPASEPLQIPRCRRGGVLVKLLVVRAALGKHALDRI